MPETASDDLIERLRDCVTRYGDGRVMGLTSDVSGRLLMEAASRLAALQQRVEITKRDFANNNDAWLKAARKALAGDTRELSNRVELSDSTRYGPVVQSALSAHKEGGDE